MKQRLGKNENVRGNSSIDGGSGRGNSYDGLVLVSTPGQAGGSQDSLAAFADECVWRRQ